ncbi:MAG TPA: acetylxylan esterase, partial [Isosphaeraceae bacterium]
MSTCCFLVVAPAVLLLAARAGAQQPDINYDESQVPAYTLPDPLVAADGDRVTTPEAWRQRRRPELLHLFERYVYGKAPGRPADLAFEVTSEDKHALDGKATRKEVSIYFSR